MAHPRALDDKTEKAVAKRYAQGESSSDLARLFSVHRSTVRNAVLRQGGTLRSPGGVAGKRLARA